MDLLRKKQRAFSGLAGSPLAITSGSPKPRRGRPRKYASDAERMRANRKAAKHEAQQTPKYWNKVLANAGLSVSQGLFMNEAEKGTGKLVTGGWDTDKICEVVAASERDGKTIGDMGTGGGGSGRRSSKLPTPIGRSTDADEIDLVQLVQRYHEGGQPEERLVQLDEEEPDEAPVQKQEKKLSTNKGKIPPKGEWVAKMLCPTHSEVSLQVARWDKKIKLFVLDCGCTRPLALE